MDSAANVILVLQLLVNLGPLALYFIILGLVNSQRCPRLISSRADFVTLTVVFMPLLVWPVPFLVSHGLWWLLGLGAAAVCGAFAALLPEPYAGWVIYHTGRPEVEAILHHAARRLGWDVRCDEAGTSIPEANLRYWCSAFPWLGSVSIHLEPLAGRADAGAIERFRAEIERRLERRSLLPSPVGAGLVLVGIVLWVVPLWMVFRHMDAIVDVVQHFLFA
ncbi:MAG: hypothetical protein ACPMAQ_07870 [Phycisphaerae bacterium]